MRPFSKSHSLFRVATLDSKSSLMSHKNHSALLSNSTSFLIRSASTLPNSLSSPISNLVASSSLPSCAPLSQSPSVYSTPVRFIHNPLRFRRPQITRRLSPKERKALQDSQRKPFKLGPVLPPQFGPWKHRPFAPCQAWVVNMQMEPVSLVDLDRRVFETEVRKDLLHRAVVWWRTLLRQGTHKQKNRSERRGGGRKPMPQKGQGRARVGSIRAPNRKGGGRAHPKRPKDYAQKLPFKVKQAALRCALSSKMQDGNLVILDDTFVDTYSPTEMDELFTERWRMLSGLMVFSEGELDSNFVVGTRGLRYINYLPVKEANVYDILRHRTLIITKQALSQLQERATVNKKKPLFAVPELAPKPSERIMAEQYEDVQQYIPSTHTPVTVPLSDKDAQLFERLKKSAAEDL